MNKAQVVASSGLQDQAADVQFTTAATALENSFGKAFEDFASFVTEGNSGRWQTMESMHNHILFVRQQLVQVRMVVDHWSLVRLEEQADNLTDIFSFASFIFDLTSIVAAQDFANLFPSCTTFSRDTEPSTGPPTLAPAVACDLLVKTEIAEDDADDKLAMHDAEATTTNSGQEEDSAGAQPTSMTEMFITAAPFVTRLRAILDTCVDAAQVWVSMHNILTDKLGATFSSNIQEVDAVPADTMANTQTNVDLFSTLHKYLSDIAWLESQPPLDLQKNDMAAHDSDHIQRLASFCTAHRKLGTDIPMNIATKTDLGSLLESTGFGALLFNIKANYGDKIFTSHALPATSSALAGLEKTVLKLNPIETCIIDNMEKPECMFNILVEAPSATELSAWFPQAVFDESFGQSMRRWRHATLFTNLSDFVASIGMEALETRKIINLKHPEGTEHPRQIVLLSLSLKCALCDISFLAAALHTYLVVPSVAKQAMGNDFLTISAPYMLKHLGINLKSLEVTLESAEVKSLEADGWKLQTSISMARVWRSAMAAYHTRIQDILLVHFAEGLTNTALAAKAQCPAWDACLQGGVWNGKLAASMLVGKHKAVARSHNHLYDYIAKVNSAAGIVGDSPRLQQHHITSEATTVALHTLGALKDAAIVCDGVQLFVTYKDSHLGPAKASAFLQKHIPSSHPNLPAAFWAMLQALSAEEAPPTPLAAASSSTHSSSGAASSSAIATAAPEDETTNSTVKDESEPGATNSAQATPTPGQTVEVKVEGSRRALKRRKM